MLVYNKLRRRIYAYIVNIFKVGAFWSVRGITGDGAVFGPGYEQEDGMKAFLEQFYDEIVAPVTAAAPGAEHRQLRGQAEACYRALAQRLDGDTLRAVEELLDAERQASACGESEAFRQGFRAGARMMMEVYRPGEEEKPDEG